MSAYPLQDMLRVRQHREEEANQAVSRARRRLAEARAAVERKQQELKEYAAWRVAEEKRLLDSLMRRPLLVGEITDVRRRLDAVSQTGGALPIPKGPVPTSARQVRRPR